jgi:photosystem II stability/assembly factor-like uncharacterized protein
MGGLMSTEPTAEFGWRRTAAPLASSRTDDIWFLDADRGWAVNSNGHILHTPDGGDTWQRQFSASGAYLRCVGFADERHGWVGTLTPGRRLYHTSDGGTTWAPVENLPAEAPPAICGLSVVNERVVYGSGTNFPDKPAGVLKSVDGGATWTATDLGAHATLLVDVFFSDEERGWVVGGKAEVSNPTRDDVVPVVLFTEDGGRTWENRLTDIGAALPRGEWGWKIYFLDERVGFVSLENESDGAILKTLDGGSTWTRKPINDPQDNANLEGIGFADGMLGWTGGWGDSSFQGGFTSETRDGGETWSDANHVGKFLNRFRFIREPELVGYASGDTVYKYSAAPVDDAEQRLAAASGEADPYARTGFPVLIPVDPQTGAESVRVDVWDRFGDHLATPYDESAPTAGPREVSWSGETESGGTAGPGVYIYRVTIDEDAESGTVLVEE